ncbi:MAG: FAD-binding oxidoreductase [Thermoplasmata archaeon]|nr:MAG: FAD-binding oxidoreductase [Thermoplasmata archaeon]
MKVSEMAYKALSNVLGPDYVTSDPAIMQAYAGGQIGYKSIHRSPDCVVLPKDTEEVQAIYRLANQYEFCVIPVGTNLFPTCVPSDEGYIIIDPKRMDKIIEIDEKNMYAVVEPYVTFFQLQTETMKVGLTSYVSGAGSQISVMANLLFQGSGFQSYRLGQSNRSWLAMEWVLPDGEIWKTGSASIEGGYFWGEGPGPVMKNLVKGWCGMFGGIGMCTKIGIKLHPWAGPPIFPVKGVVHKKVHLPKNKFKIVGISFPSLQTAIDAMYEIGKAEIGSQVVLIDALLLAAELSESKDDFWKLWESGMYKKVVGYKTIFVILQGYASDKQLIYEEKVLKHIYTKLGGKLLPPILRILLDRVFLAENIRAIHTTRIMRPAGCFISVKEAEGSLDHAVKTVEASKELVLRRLKRKKTMENYLGVWINAMDFCHYCHCEPFIVFHWGKAEIDALALAVELKLEDIKAKRYNELPIVPQSMLDSEYGNLGLYVGKIKKEFDPNNVANPPWPLGSFGGI